jgi:hypothetical protein
LQEDLAQYEHRSGRARFESAETNIGEVIRRLEAARLGQSRIRPTNSAQSAPNYPKACRRSAKRNVQMMADQYSASTCDSRPEFSERTGLPAAVAVAVALDQPLCASVSTMFTK